MARVFCIVVVLLALVKLNLSLKRCSFGKARPCQDSFSLQSSKWDSSSWRNYPIQQDIQYQDEDKLKEVLDKLELSDPVVRCEDIDTLQAKLAQVCDGNGFVLMGGDCAESFNEFSHENVRDTFVLLQQMTLILKAGRPSGSIIPIGNIISHSDGVFNRPHITEILMALCMCFLIQVE